MADRLDGLRTIPGPDPGACPKCGQWRKAGMSHECADRPEIEEARRNMKLLRFTRWDPGWSLVIWRWQFDRHVSVDGKKSLLWGRRSA